MTKKRIQVKKKLALLLASTLLVTSINVMPVEAAGNNQKTGEEVQKAVASTNLSLEKTSAPTTDQMHTEHGSEWKDLNDVVTPDPNSGSYKITESGKYYLSGDITCTSSAVIIGDGVTATICLDGHTISATGTGTAISVPLGASLTIEDCSEPESGTGTVTVTGSGANVIDTRGSLVVNRVNVTHTGTGRQQYAIKAGDGRNNVGSVVIKNSKLKAKTASLDALCVDNITIEATECTGQISAVKNKNMTVSGSTINKDTDDAICYANGQGGTITITNSVLTTTSSMGSDAGLMCQYSERPITINIEDSIINSPKIGIDVDNKNGENLKISNSQIICTNTEPQDSEYAISYGYADVDSGNKLEVSDVEIKNWNTGIRICSDDSNNPEMNFTLSGDVKFEKKAPLNTDIDFPTRGEGKVNLHFNDLNTRNMVINAYSGKMENIICDDDYSTYFIDSKYVFNSEKDGEKYVLNCTPRSITRQPTAENPKIAVNDASNVSYQWYSAQSSENPVITTIEDYDYRLGTYEGGSWKPDLDMYGQNVYAYDLTVNLKAGDLVILENPDGTLASMKEVLNCSGPGTPKKEYKGGKLYFTIPSDGNYNIYADTMYTVVYGVENWPINADTRLKIAVKRTSLTGKVNGSTQANLVTPEAGTFCCKATWAKGTAFEYSVLSDVVTVTQPIAQSKYTVTVNYGTSGATEYAAGEKVTITANPAPEGKEFDKWEVTSGGVTLADATQSTTTFLMPESAVTVQAIYKDVSAPTPDPEPTPDPDPTPIPDPQEHTWIYTASGATLTATCSNGNNHNHKATLTLTATSPTYSGDGVTTGWNVGETVAFTLAGEEEWKAVLGNDAVPVIKYVGTGSTAYAESETAPTAAGTYKATITKESKTAEFAFEMKEAKPSDDTENILAKAQEIVTSKINKLSVSNLTTNEDIENAIKTALLSDDKTKSVESKITAEKTEAKVGTDGQIAINVKLILNDKNITFDLNKTITALFGRNITVTVQDDGNQPISDAEVKVMLGNTEKVKPTLSDQGVYEFPNLPAGLYNIVITKDGVTKTAIANITTDNATVSVEWDASSVGSSHLDVKETTVPKAATKVEETVVKNLDALAEALKETDPEVSSYKVDMVVEAKADAQIPQNTQNEMVKAANKGESAATDKATNIDFLDISIIKTITKSSGMTETKQIADTADTVIEIIIPFNFTGKTNVKVLREHNGEVKKFEKIDTITTGAEGTYKIDEENGLIILYAKYFSTYAVSYVAEGETALEESTTPTYPAYTGGGSVSVTVPATGITIEADKYEITKEGETVAIKAAIQPSNATDKKLTFTSSDEKVAKVDANGVITAVGNGTVTITIKAANGITKTITVTVNIPSEENKDDNSSAEEEAVTPAKTAANAIAINKGLKVSQTGTKINVSWGKVADADGYLVYAAYCGTDIGKAIKTIKDPSSVSTTITKLGGKKLDLKKNFKVYVKAYKLVDGKKAAFGKSITAHIAGSKNTKETNGKEIKLTSKSKLTLAVGKTSKIKAKVVLVDATKKQLSDSHTKEFRYASSDQKVAAVDKNGKITAKAKGTCYIYVYAKNGYAKKVTVTVK